MPVVYAALLIVFLLYPLGLLLYQWYTFSAVSATSTAAADIKVDALDKEAVRNHTAANGSPQGWLLAGVGCSVWLGICALPLVLTWGNWYRRLFPEGWYDEYPQQPKPGHAKPLGLLLGIAAVVVGHVFLILYHGLRRSGSLGVTRRIQAKERTYFFLEGLRTHLFQPEGFALIGGYLVGTWMLGWMPPSYYSFAGGVNWLHVAAQLLLQDLIQFAMHLLEHKASVWVYQNSHKPHHRFTNPRLFDAYNGSALDTTLMILVPFVITARFVPANVWSYMTFGTLYANWLVLIHSEFAHPWEGVFRTLGLGTAADHHVHHSVFVFNYGHLFMYWDKLAGTYRDPAQYAETRFNKGV